MKFGKPIVVIAATSFVVVALMINRIKTNESYGSPVRIEPELATAFAAQAEDRNVPITLIGSANDSLLVERENIDDFEQLLNNQSGFLERAKRLDDNGFLALCEEISRLPEHESVDLAGVIAAYAATDRRGILPQVFDIFASEESGLSSNFLYPGASSVFAEDGFTEELLEELSLYENHPAFIHSVAMRIGKDLGGSDDLQADIELINIQIDATPLAVSSIDALIDGMVGGLADHYPEYALDSLSRVEHVSPSTVRSLETALRSLSKTDGASAFSRLEGMLSPANGAHPVSRRFIDSYIGVLKRLDADGEIARILSNPEIPADLHGMIVVNYLSSFNPSTVDKAQAESLLTYIRNPRIREQTAAFLDREYQRVNNK